MIGVEWKRASGGIDKVRDDPASAGRGSLRRERDFCAG